MSAPGTFETAREIAAGVDDVFAAFADPTRLARWWGPAGFTNTFELCELTTGGRWRYVMHGPDGRDYKNESVFLAVEPGRRVVIHHISGPVYRLTITLAATSTGTRVAWSQAFERVDVAEKIAHIVVPANEENLDRLVAELTRAPL